MAYTKAQKDLLIIFDDIIADIELGRENGELSLDDIVERLLDLQNSLEDEWKKQTANKKS